MINLFLSVEHIINNRILGAPRHWLAQIISRWLSPLVILGALFLSVALPAVSPRLLMVFLALFPAAGSVLVFIRWPMVGLASLIISCLLLPSPNLPGGFNLAVLLLMLLIGLWLLDMLVLRHEVRLVQSRTVRPLLALVIVAILSFGVGQLKWFNFAPPAPLDAQLGGLAIFILAAGVFLLIADQVRDLRWLQRLTWLFLALGGLFIAGWLVPGVAGITGRLFQTGATANSMFWTWLVSLAFSQAFLNDRLHMRWRLALAGLVAATMYVAFVVAYEWKSGYLPPMASIAVMIGLRNWRAGLAMALVVPFGAYYLSQDAMTADEYSYSTRLDAWLIIFEMVKLNPILGFGPANYYWYTPLFPIRGYAVVFNSHSQIVDLIAQTGLLGLACFLWFFWEMGWLGWRLRHQVPAGFAQAYVYGVLGGIAGTLTAATLADWLLPFAYNIGLNGFRGAILAWLFLGGLVSLEQIGKRLPVPGMGER